MKRLHAAQSRRPAGVVTTLTAILAIPMMAMLAFCIYLGYIHNVQVECQNVADSASLAGTSRATVTRALSNWRRRGIIRTGQRDLTITDLRTLRKIAGQQP